MVEDMLPSRLYFIRNRFLSHFYQVEISFADQIAAYKIAVLHVRYSHVSKTTGKHVKAPNKIGFSFRSTK